MLQDFVSRRHLASENDLLERARRGDPAAFEALIRPHIPSIRRFAFAFAKSWSDADDLAQEALLKAYRSLHSFRGESALSTWLYMVTKNACRDSLRGKLESARRREDELEESHLDDRESVPTLLAKKREAESLWDAIRELPAEFRTALVLFEIEGRPYDEIAEVEGVPIGTIRSRLSRARSRLVAALGPIGDGDSGTTSSHSASHAERPPTCPS